MWIYPEKKTTLFLQKKIIIGFLFALWQANNFFKYGLIILIKSEPHLWSNDKHACFQFGRSWVGSPVGSNQRL